MNNSNSTVGFSLTQQNNYYGFWQRQKEFQNQAHNYSYYCEHYQNYYSNWDYDSNTAYSNYGFTSYDNVQPTPNPFPAAAGGDSAWTSAFSEFQEMLAAVESNEQEPVADPDIYLNVDELNRAFMARSEDLYDSLINCQWQPLDTITSEIPETVSDFVNV
ncbi:putative uncharacterized protein C6orf52 homolog isoform X2 [Rhinatrema bivittatum]|uniref:putative uncharacterized protein C6orf52 homolog isoform X2 n=1 Tax=Rhinatrema bivittatum TaxID=194408 RepID=UPI00112C8A93|nr:putative uncharacterized protein C6orf52 homolog isoform X2 [Rhinatrema bivittatum]